MQLFTAFPHQIEAPGLGAQDAKHTAHDKLVQICAPRGSVERLTQSVQKVKNPGFLGDHSLARGLEFPDNAPLTPDQATGDPEGSTGKRCEKDAHTFAQFDLRPSRPPTFIS
jgi:hypothetical protein